MMTKMATGLAALGLGMAVLSGCSGDSDGGDDAADSSSSPSASASSDGASATKIVSQVRSDMGALKAVRVTGDITTGAQEIKLDMQVSTSGDCTGTLSYGGGTTELLGTGGSVWMRPDEAFWKSFASETADQIINAVGDKWVIVPEGNDGVNEFCDLDEMLDSLMSDDAEYTEKGTDEVDGSEVLVIESTDEDEGTSTGFVLADAPHYLVKVERTEGTEPGSVTFSEFDEPIQVKAPGKNQVIDLGAMSPNG